MILVVPDTHMPMTNLVQLCTDRRHVPQSDLIQKADNIIYEEGSVRADPRSSWPGRSVFRASGWPHSQHLVAAVAKETSSSSF